MSLNLALFMITNRETADKLSFAKKPDKDGVWDVAIIGSGPAGLTAAVYTTRGAASTLILAGENWGGQLTLTTTVDNYPGFPEGIQGPELMNSMKRQVERFGAEFVQKNVESVSFTNDPKEIIAGGINYLAKTVIIASGADTKWLEVPGEDKLRGRGVSSCAPCDAPFFKGKRIAVVGGGDSAMEEALVLTKYASSVIMIHRRDEFKASAAMQSKVMRMRGQGKINIVWSSEVVEMIGEEKLEKVVLKSKLETEQAKLLKEGKTDTLQFKIIEEKEGYLFWEISLDGLFVAIGHIPATEMFKNILDLDERGYIVKTPTKHNQDVNEKDHYHAKTSIPGVFVAGDVHDHVYRQAITAAGFGCMAGMDALRYLDKATPSW